MLKLTLKQGVPAESEVHLDPIDLADVDRIITACREAGYEIDQLTTYNAWSAYSEHYSASWLFLPQEEDTWLQAILKYCDQKEC